MLRFALLLGLLAAFGPLAIDMYLPALPAIGAEFGVGTDAAQLTLAAFFAGIAIGHLFHGPLADRFGRRRPLFAGIALFVLASIGCALAPSLDALVALRFVQALAGCAGMVICRAIARDVADRLDPVRLMGRLMLVMGVAPILAPLLGGFVAQHLGWRAIFLVLAGLGALALALCAAFLPETLPQARRRAGGVATALRGYAALLGQRRFLAAALPGACAISGMFAYIAGSPFVFIQLHGVAPENYGLLFGAGAAFVIAASQGVGRLADAWGREVALSRALLSLAAAAALVLAASWLAAPLWLLLLPLMFYMAMMGVILPLAGLLSIQPFPEMAGSASALVGTLQFLLGALAGTAVSTFHDGTGLPMGAVMAAAATLALVARRALSHANGGGS